MTDSKIALANSLFPDVVTNEEILTQKYPPRTAPIVIRIAPSPTGFLHIGTTFTALLGERIAHLNGGIFYYRSEDTDAKREIEGAVQLMISGLQRFGIQIDEGPLGANEGDVGAYGPYTQSLRKDIYQVFAKKLIAE